MVAPITNLNGIMSFIGPSYVFYQAREMALSNILYNIFVFDNQAWSL